MTCSHGIQLLLFQVVLCALFPYISMTLACFFIVGLGPMAKKKHYQMSIASTAPHMDIIIAHPERP
jgi:hypothetical protein